MNTNFMKSALLLSCASVFALSTEAAIAQQGQAADEVSDQIIVTGLKRDQSILDAPVSVQVFDAQQIEDAGITRPDDYLALTSNVTFINASANHAGEAFVNIRGQTSVRQSESAIAVVVDGVQLATQNEFNGDLFDVQQIEILKGPQNALYGRNASAGAIVITTKTPEDEFGGQASLRYGNWNSSRATLAVTGALIPGKLRARLSGSFSDTNGPFENIISGEHPLRSNEKAGRFRLDWDDGGPFTADFRFNISRVEGGGIAANAQGPGIVNGGVPSPVDGNSADEPYVTETPGLNIQDKLNTSLKLTYDLGGAVLESISSWSSVTDDYQAALFPYQAAADPRNDAGNAILFGDQTQKFRIDNENFIQEIRLTSQNDGPLSWQVGGFFLTGDRNFVTEQGYNGRVLTDAMGAPIIGVAGYAPNPDGPIFASLDPAISNFLFGETVTNWERLLVGGGAILPTIGIDGLDSVNPTNAYDISQYDTRNLAGFANVQYDITDRLTLSLAGRYDVERREVETQTPDQINPFTGATFNQCVALFGVSPAECNDERTFKQFQPKVSLNYNLGEYGSVFASWGRSFKSGGFNAIGVREIVVRATQGGVLTREEAEALVFVQDFYDKEVADAYEAGFKLRPSDRLTLNGALFWTDVDNAQQFIFFPAGSIQAVQAIDATRIRGFELDATLNVTDSLSLFAGGGYLDHEIRRNEAEPTSVGNKIPGVADYNLAVGFQLNHPISDTLDLVARGEYTRTGPTFFDSTNTPGTRRDAFGLVNLRAGVSTDRFDFALWTRNLTDERYRSENVVLVTGVGVFNPGFRAPTRSYGAEVRARF